MSERFLGYVINQIKNSDPTKGNHAIIKVIAKKNLETGKYEKLNLEESKIYCPPNGNVFAPIYYSSFYSSFNTYQFVEFGIKKGEGKEQKGFNDTDYLVEYDSKPKGVSLILTVPYNGKVETIIRNKYISQKELIDTLDKESLFSGQDTNFLIYDENTNDAIGIFKYIANSNSIEANYGKEVQYFHIPAEQMIFTNDQRFALINVKGNTLERKGVIDFMNDSQLADWFSKKFNDIANLNKQAVSTICNFSESQSIEDDLDLIRLERVKFKADAINLDIQTVIKIISQNPTYLNNIEKIEKDVKAQLEKELIDNASGKIQENKKIIDNQNSEINSLKGNIEKLKSEYKAKSEENKERIKKENEKLIAKIEEKQKQLNDLNTNYDQVLATLQAALPVLNTSTQKEEASNESNEVLTPAYFPAEGITYTELQSKTDESVKSLLLRNIAEKNDGPLSIVTTVKNLLAFKACFVPSGAWAFIFAKAIRNAEVYTLNVEYDWLHYSDYCKHGLLQPFMAAHKNPEKNYILLLEGMNIVQPETGLRPLLNLINGTEPVLKDCNIPFPKNLTIFATLLSVQGENPIGLKLQQSFYTKWGTLGNPTEEKYQISLLDDSDIAPETDNSAYFLNSELHTDNPVVSNPEKLKVYFEY